MPAENYAFSFRFHGFERAVYDLPSRRRGWGSYVVNRSVHCLKLVAWTYGATNSDAGFYDLQI